MMLDPPPRLLMGSGPSNPEPRVLRALTTPPLPGDDPALEPLLDAVMRGARDLFQTQNTCTFPVAGASRSGVEAVLAGVVEEGDRVLVGVYGHFGELLCALAERHGAVVERVDAEWGSAIDPQRLVDQIARNPPKLVAIVHADTSTGVLQPLEAIGRACREADTLLLVDAVLSLGGGEVAVDAWGLDAAAGGLQKCVGGPPGLAPVTYNERARSALRRRAAPPHSAYLDLARLEAAWVERRGLADATLPIPMLYGFAEALAAIGDEGLPGRWDRHERAGRALRAGLSAMGLTLFGDSRTRAPMISIVEVPDAASEAGVRQKLLDEHGVEIMAAFGPLRGRVWRIGCMGANARLDSVLRVLSALEAVLAGHHVRVARGAAVEAAREAFGPPAPGS